MGKTTNRNVTVVLEDEVARWARLAAAERDNRRHAESGPKQVRAAAVVVAAAQAADCSHLLTEDLPDGQSLDGLVVTNPFTLAGSDLL